MDYIKRIDDKTDDQVLKFVLFLLYKRFYLKNLRNAWTHYTYLFRSQILSKMNQ